MEKVIKTTIERPIQEIKSWTEKDMIIPADKFNQQERIKHYANEVVQTYKNFHILDKELDDGTSVPLGNLPKHTGEPILLVGSGPSLNDAKDILKNWEGDIMTSTSQAVTCHGRGKTPKFVMVLDVDCSWKDFEKMDRPWSDLDTTILHHPGVDHSIVENWHGKRGLFRKKQADVFYDDILKIGYSSVKTEYDLESIDKDSHDYENVKMKLIIRDRIQTELLMMGCVMNSQVFAAVALEYSPIYLLGYDLGYPDGEERFDRVVYNGSSWEETEKHIDSLKREGPARKQMTIDSKPGLLTSDNGIFTEPMMIFYKTNFMCALRISKHPIISCSRGIISEIPQVPIDKVIEAQGDIKKIGVKPLSKTELIKISNEYLAKKQTITVLFKPEESSSTEALQFVQWEKSVTEIKDYMRRIMNTEGNRLKYNATLTSMKRLAREKILPEEEAKKVLSWEYLR